MATNINNLSDEMRDELAQLAIALSNNKKTRKGFLGLVKEAAPDTPIPEIDGANALEERLSAERTAREKFEAEQRDRWLQQDLGARKTNVKDKYGLTEEQMKTMEERMGKKELPTDYEWAARLFTQEIEPVGATNYGSSGFGPFEMPSAEGLMENEQRWSLQQAHQMIDDMQKGKAPAF